jgi:hypothetical protein
MIATYLGVLQLGLKWDAPIGDRPYVLGPALPFLEADQPTEDALPEKSLSVTSLKHASIVTERFPRSWLAWRAQTKVARVALVFWVAAVPCPDRQVMKSRL